MAPLLHSVRDEQFEARAADTLSNRWVKAAVEAARGRDHGFQSSPFAAEAARLERERGAASRAGFLRQALRGVIAESRPQIASLPVPDEVKANFRTEFERIEKETSTATDEHYDLERHGMRCDFRIAGFGRIPMRFGHIEVGGVPRRHLIRGGVAQALSLGSLLASVGGHAPFYVSHFTHTISPLAFLLLASPERVVEGLRTVGECLKLNPHIRGLLATSWWYDPQLTQVAPHLAYLRETSVAHGALLVRAGRTDGAVKMALANSPQRQRLYDEGRYFPESYALVWSRQSLLKLAASTPSPGTR
jgi:hypothetical protein